MKANLKLLATIAILGAIVISSCKKKDDLTPADPDVPGTTTAFLINTDSTYDGNVSNTQVRKFVYNGSKQLVKIAHKSGTSTTFYGFDTLIYNSAGQVSAVNSYTTGNATIQGSSKLTFTSGLLTSALETGNNGSPYVRTRTFTYASGKPISQTVTYTTGASAGGGPENITSIVFAGNNISSADLGAAMGGSITLTASTTAANPYYGLYFDSEDFINLFNQNNILKAYVTSNPTLIFVDNTYTYAAGRVSRISDASKNPARVTDITYKEY